MYNQEFCWACCMTGGVICGENHRATPQANSNVTALLSKVFFATMLTQECWHISKTLHKHNCHLWSLQELRAISSRLFCATMPHTKTKTPLHIPCTITSDFSWLQIKTTSWRVFCATMPLTKPHNIGTIHANGRAHCM